MSWRSLIGFLWRSKPTAKDRLQIWWFRFRVGLFALVAAWVFQVALQKKGFFEYYDNTDADKYARTDKHALYDNSKLEYSSRIAIVSVDENDYKEMFESKSPLDPKKLKELIRKVQDYHPRIIAVDFLTADWLSALGPDEMRSKPPIVWARDGHEPDFQADTAENQNEHDEILIWNKVAGYSDPPSWLRFAVPVNQPDPDGVIRWYSHSVRGANADGHSASDYQTMERVLALSYSDQLYGCPGGPRPGECRIRFNGENYRFKTLRASDVTADANRRLGKYLAGHIVLIGGTYAAARDRYKSGGGVYSGVEILANEIESELTGPIKDIPETYALVISLVLSIGLYMIAFRLAPGLDLLFTLLCLSLYSFGGGWILYHYFHVFSPIASALLSLPIGIIFQHCIECYLLEKRLQKQGERS